MDVGETKNHPVRDEGTNGDNRTFETDEETTIVSAGANVLIIGAVISTAAFGEKWGLGQFVVGRVVSGLGNGMNTATIPVWQSECSSKDQPSAANFLTKDH